MRDIIKVADELRQQYSGKLPPVQQWDPELSGTMDMVIDRQGKWFHNGEEILRLPLVKLFSTILKREGDDYFLITPVEKWKITVEDAPFVVVKCEVKHNDETQSSGTNDDQQLLCLTTLTDDFIVVDKEHPLWVEGDSKGEPSPYVMVRDNMPAIIGRNVYYQLVNLALSGANQNESADEVFVYSAGEKFSLKSVQLTGN